MISMSTGFPSPRFHPVEEMAEIARQVFAEEGEAALSYTEPEGHVALREQIATHVDGEPLDPDQVIVTTGAQQALDIVYRDAARARPTWRSPSHPPSPARCWPCARPVRA